MDKLPEETFDKKVNVYCQLSRKRPPMSSGGGPLREVVTYESLDHNGSKFSSLEYDNCRDLKQCFIHVKVNFEEKIRFFPLRNFRFLH